MAWGDAWGTTPRENALRLAKAFYDGQEYGGIRATRVVRHDWAMFFEYRYKNFVIAKYTPPSLIPEMVAKQLEGEKFDEGTTLFKTAVFRSGVGDKGEMRHLKALGLEAQFQYGKDPFLVFGASTHGLSGFHTIAEFKAMPKWEKPVAPVRRRRESFVNLTAPLFG